MRRARARLRRGGGLAVRQPRAVRRRARTSRATRATSSATSRWPRPRASTCCSPPRSRRSTRPASTPGVAVGGLTDVLEGDSAQRGREHFAGVTTVVTKLFNMVGPRRGLLRPEGRPAGARDPPSWCAISTSRCGSRSAPPCATPTGLALSSRNAYLSAEERERAAGPQPRAARGGGQRGRPASSTRAAGAGRRARRARRGRNRPRLPGAALRHRPLDPVDARERLDPACRGRPRGRAPG